MNQKIIVIFTMIFGSSICIYAQSIQYSGIYILKDSLSKNHTSRLVWLDIKVKKINLQIGNEKRVFVQENSLDATQRFQKQNLFQRIGSEYFVLNISELKRVESDSIYVSASIQKFNEKGNVGKPKKSTILL